MKKSKLIASICTLVLTLACLTFGVYSAVKTTFTASGTIVFNAYNIDLDVKGTIKGTAEAVTDFYATTTYSETAKTDATRQTYNQNNLASGWNFGNIAFDELGANSNGYIDNTITITLSFTNYSGFPVKVNVEQTSTNANLTITKNDIQYISKYDTSTLATADTQVVTIIITPNGTAISKESLVFNVNAQPSELTEATAAELTYTITDGKAVISAYTGTSDTFVIPSKVTDNGTTYATSLNAGSYDSTTKVLTAGVTLPSTVTAVVVPGAMEQVSEVAFGGNTSLQSVTFCSGVKNIGTRAFNSNTSLSYIGFGETIQTIGQASFSGKDTAHAPLYKNVAFPDSLVSLGIGAFANCINLESFTFSENSQITTISDGCFSVCETLKAVRFPKNSQITVIPTSCFFKCTTIESVIIPDSVVTIGNQAFGACSSLKNVDFGGSVKSIGKLAFAGTPSMPAPIIESMVLPDSVESVGVAAFQYCTKLSNLKLPNNENFTIINQNTFAHCSSLKSVTLPDSILEIGYAAFSNCDSLQSVSFSSNLKKIVAGAFNKCSALKKVVLPDSLEHIEHDAFWDCTGLNSIVIGSGVKYIDVDAFGNIAETCTIEFKDTTSTWSRYAANGSDGDYTKGDLETSTLTAADMLADNAVMLRGEKNYYFEKNA